MENYELAALTVTEGQESRALTFDRAKLTVVSEYGTRLWFIDVDGVKDKHLLQRFADTDDIGVNVVAVTIEGKHLSGRGFFHPNPPRQGAAIRGEGELDGYA